MGINKRQTLRTVFLKYLITSIFICIFVSALALLTLNLFFKSGLIIPANNIENQILTNKRKIAIALKFDEKELPDGVNYLLMSIDDKVISSDMDEKLKKNAIKYHVGEKISSSKNSFMEIKRRDEYLILSYSLMPRYKNDWVDSNFPSVNVIFYLIFILYFLAAIMISTLMWVKYLKRELNPIVKASSEIAKENLDFEIEMTDIREFNMVLHSLDEMKNALSASLKKNWEEEENRRNEISALNHDLKTPVSILKANKEMLLMEEVGENAKAYVEYMAKNADRIIEYAEAISDINTTFKNELNLKKQNANEIFEMAREIGTEIALANGLEFKERVDFKDINLNIDMKLLERALQNIFINAASFSKEGSKITLEVSNDDMNFYISILDEGEGFSNEDLIYAKNRFYTKDKSRHGRNGYGLGLYIADRIVKLNGGELILKNREEIGAEVVIKLKILQ